MKKPSALAALAKKWVETWKLAGEDLERIRRKEIRELDTYLPFFCFADLRITADLLTLQNPWSGLIEQQRWFKKADGGE